MKTPFPSAASQKRGTMKKQQNQKMEKAVTDFLVFLENPKEVERAVVQGLRTQLSAVGNPIDKLRLIAEMDKVSASHIATLEADFVSFSHAWANANDIPAHAFVSLGVDRAVLRKAGFEIEPERKRKLAPKRVPKPRAKSVTGETVEQLVLGLKGSFTVRDVASASKATNATVSRVLGELVAANRIEQIGTIARQGFRGAPPVGYRVPSK
jgi:hypothetical protein